MRNIASFGMLIFFDNPTSPTVHEGFQKPVVEGDSQLTIKMLKGLSDDYHNAKNTPTWLSVCKISHRWRLERSLECIHSLVSNIKVITLSHVKCSANKVGDIIAIEGVI